MRRRRVGPCGLAVVALLLAGCGEAQSAGCLTPPEDARGDWVVESVVDGDTVVLDDRSEVRMVGIQAPKLPLGRRGFVEWPLAREARDAAVALADGRRVMLWSGGAAADRHGRRLAHAYVQVPDGDPVWFQGEMLRQGWARVYSFADNRACIGELLAMEAEARAARRGMWALETYRIIEAGEIDRLTAREASYELVEGRVRSAKIISGRGYLNFGDDYRTDFTVSVSPRDMKLFRAADVDLTSLAGRMVRARGWLRSFNGPSIEATHPEQIEVLQ